MFMEQDPKIFGLSEEETAEEIKTLIRKTLMQIVTEKGTDEGVKFLEARGLKKEDFPYTFIMANRPKFQES